jgi:hypothetical protein
MKSILLIAGLLSLGSCAEINKIIADTKTPVPAMAQAPKVKKVSTSKKVTEAKKVSTKPDISGELANGTLFDATPDDDGFVISFDPFLARNDKTFTDATKHLMAKLYNDKIKDESHISIESDIDYTIFKGHKAHYKIVPFKESNGEISSITITTLKL